MFSTPLENSPVGSTFPIMEIEIPVLIIVQLKTKNFVYDVNEPHFSKVIYMWGGLIFEIFILLSIALVFLFVRKYSLAFRYFK